MKLRTTDQIHISAVSPDTLRPHTEFDVSDAFGKDLLAQHPSRLVAVKTERAPKNKAEAPPANKSTTRRKT